MAYGPAAWWKLYFAKIAILEGCDEQIFTMGTSMSLRLFMNAQKAVLMI